MKKQQLLLGAVVLNYILFCVVHSGLTCVGHFCLHTVKVGVLIAHKA